MRAYFMNGETQELSWVDAVALKRDFLFIDFDPYRDLSRWTHTKRKRAYLVEKWVSAGGFRVNYSAHTTEINAVKTITKFLKG